MKIIASSRSGFRVTRYYLAIYCLNSKAKLL